MSGNLTAEKDNEEKRKQFFLPFSVDRILQIDRDCSKRTKIDYETYTKKDDDLTNEASKSPNLLPTYSPSQDQNDTSSTELLHDQLEQSGIIVKLIDHDLWQKFHANGTEMIITKAGRRMFPCLKVQVSGLDPDEIYMFFIEIVPFDNKRYRYVYLSSKWAAAGAGDPLPESCSFLHPESPASGRSWMSQSPILFDKLKLTNNRTTLSDGQVCLHSMHKYLPKIHIIPLSKIGIKDFDYIKSVKLDKLRDFGFSFTFPQTVFTTVTAYQNQQITRLKIESNPFAKGFREATRTRDVGYPNDLADYPPPLFDLPLMIPQRFYPFPFHPPSPHLGYMTSYPPHTGWLMQCLPSRGTEEAKETPKEV